MSDAAIALPGARPSAAGGYRYYALAVLVLVGMFNAADRSILSILAEAIRVDLAVDDAHLAFLYGTAFVTLYTLLGLPAARLADRMSRPRLLAGGLALWSCFTAVSGFASSFAMLAVARVGVGVGEATANPVSHSLICDLFPVRQRARMLAVYLAGIFIGGGATAAIAGHILDYWPQMCGAAGLCSLRPWQAAFLVVGLPGLLLALLLLGLREPMRGQSDGEPVVPPATGHWRACWQDFLAVVPGIATLALLRRCGPAVARRHAIIAAILLAAASAMAGLTGDTAQWMALFVGVNAIMSWTMHGAAADPALVRLTIGTRAFLFGLIGYAFMGGIMGAAHFWMIPYAIRMLGVSAGEAGLVLGPVIVASSLVGVLGGGFASDALRARDPRGHLWWSLAVLGLLAVTFAAMLTMTTITGYAVAAFLFNAASVGWSGSAAAQAQDLVLPRMRATTSAINALSITLVTMAVGPYAAGKIGQASGSLHLGLFSMIALVPIAAIFLFLASRQTADAAATKAARAGAA